MFVEKKQKECGNLWDYNIHDRIFKSLSSSRTHGLSAHMVVLGLVCLCVCLCEYKKKQKSFSCERGKYLSAWIVGFDLDKSASTVICNVPVLPDEPLLIPDTFTAVMNMTVKKEDEGASSSLGQLLWGGFFFLFPPPPGAM